MNVLQLYRNRFSSPEILNRKQKVWQTLCRYFFSKWIKSTDSVLDIGAGYCEFINHIFAKKKYAFDINPDLRRFAAKDVHIIIGSLNDLKKSYSDQTFSKIFISNFLEHLESRDEIIRLFNICHELLCDDGCLLILQPNIRLVGHQYWDYFDHKIPLTEYALIELCNLTGFEPQYCIPGFIPYSFRKSSSFCQTPFVVWLYLKTMPISNWLFGKQAFLVAKKVLKVHDARS